MAKGRGTKAGKIKGMDSFLFLALELKEITFEQAREYRLKQLARIEIGWDWTLPEFAS